MRISDWSSDVCSSDLHRRVGDDMVGDRDREVDEAGHGGDAAPTRPLVQGGTAVMTEGDNRICRLPRACRRAALFLSAQRKNGPSTSSGRKAWGEQNRKRTRLKPSH